MPSFDQFTRYLILVGVLSSTLYLSGAWYAHLKWFDIAPQFTGNTSLNQKLLFLKNRWPRTGPTTVIIGASVALNNFDGDRLQQVEGRDVLNIGAEGLALSETIDLFTKAERIFTADDVIFVGPFDLLFDPDSTAFEVPEKVFDRYIKGEMNWIEEFSYRDVPASVDMAKHRDQFLNNRASVYTNDFTSTGSLPLEVYWPDIYRGRLVRLGWRDTYDCVGCGATLEKLCHDVVMSGRQFTMIVPPLSPYIMKQRPDIRNRYEKGRAMLEHVLNSCGGKFFDVGRASSFGDSCFVDFLHLNAEGARRVTDLFVAWRRDPSMVQSSRFECPAPQNGLPPVDQLRLLEERQSTSPSSYNSADRR